MGGTPVTALAIAAFPKDDLEPDAIRAILMGGFDKLREAGVALLGGHTVQDREIKFGYAVTGAIDPARVLTNAGAKPGDVVFLTKPLGTGIVGTAIKFARAPEALESAAIASMRTLNRAAADAIRSLPAGAVHACTDITGFGLIGHGSALAKASGVTLDIHADRLPLFDGVLGLASGNRSGGLGSNQEHFSPGVRVQPGVDASLEILLYDPQTSGGLLVTVAEDAADELAAALTRAGVLAQRVGSVQPAIRDVLVRVGLHG
jgi:selenide,water dikinase